MDHLLKMLNSNSLVQIGSAPNVFSCCFNYTPWIIDSRVFDHMTSFSNLFNTYSPCFGSEKIGIADGSISPIAKKGLVKLSENIDLKSVLHVPKLACNLFYVSKLTKNSNCRVFFYDSHYEFQDQNLRKKIGSAKLIGDLYYFVVFSPINGLRALVVLVLFLFMNK